MSYSEAFLYGLLQGITEYLPVSSSAHLILLPRFLGTKDPGLGFDVFLHFGTLLATLLYFRKDWQILLVNLLQRKKDKRLLFCLVVGTIPALVAGALFHHWVESTLRATSVLVATLSLGGVALHLLDRRGRKSRTLDGLRIKDAWWIGFAQMFALIPGVSRSGSTMMGGLALGLTRDAAARFSFLLSAPVTAAAIAYEGLKLRKGLPAQMDLSVYAVAGISSFVFGWLAIDGLLKIVKRFSYFSFAVYRVVLALVIAILL